MTVTPPLSPVNTAKIDQKPILDSPTSSPPASSKTIPIDPPTSIKRDDSTKSPSTPNKKARRASICVPSSTPGSQSSPSTGGTIDWSKIEGWTPEKREAFMTRIIGAGVSSIGSVVLAEEFGMTKFGINNAISAGKKGNMREKAVR